MNENILFLFQTDGECVQAQRKVFPSVPQFVQRKNVKMRPCQEEVKQKERKDNVGKYLSQPLCVYVSCNEFTLWH